MGTRCGTGDGSASFFQPSPSHLHSVVRMDGLDSLHSFGPYLNYRNATTLTLCFCPGSAPESTVVRTLSLDSRTVPGLLLRIAPVMFPSLSTVADDADDEWLFN